MTPEDRDLARLLDRDLARIRLPDRGHWRGATRARRSWAGPLLAAPLVAALVVLAVAAGLGLQQYRQGPDRAPAVSTPSPTESPVPPPTATPGADRPFTYVHLELGYGFDLPPGWRHSPCGSGTIWRGADREIVDMIVFGGPQRASETGIHADQVRLRAMRNERGLTPRQWEQEGRHLRTPPAALEDTTLAGRPALRAAYPGRVTFLVAIDGWMYEITHEQRTSDTPAAEREAIVRSFRIVPADELAHWRAAAPAPAPGAPSPEALVDALVAGFAQRDVSRLVGLMTPCMSIGLERAGGTASERDQYARALADAFAAGRVIAVRARPIEGDRTIPGPTLHVSSTWSDSGQPDREIRLMLSPEGERWYWRGTVERNAPP